MNNFSAFTGGGLVFCIEFWRVKSVGFIKRKVRHTKDNEEF